MKCLMCDSQEFVLLGELGNNMWVRCRYCGMDQTNDLNEVQYND